MTTSVELQRAFREANERFDQFVLGALIATCAILTQTNPYARLGWNPETAHQISLLLFVMAAYFGFKRIESTVGLYRTNSASLRAIETRDKEGIFFNSAVVAQLSESCIRHYRYRNIFALLGLLSYIAAKFWLVYR